MLGALTEGAIVRARREEMSAWEDAKVVRAALLAGDTARLRFDGGYVAEVPVADIQVAAADADDDAAADASAGDGAAAAADGSEGDEGYLAAVQGLIPPPPTADALAADKEVKYSYISAYKSAGNTLFKSGEYAHAIRTYVEAVSSLATACYPAGRERMLWDYRARVPCGQASHSHVDDDTFARVVTHSLTHALTHSLTHARTHSLTHSLTH